MAVLVLANSKGGAGKSTTALILAASFIEMGLSTCVIDCDPNRPIQAWKNLNASQCPLSVVSDAREDNIISRIKEAEATFAIVVVDLEGSASLLSARAISRANLVIIPMPASPLDTDQASRATALIKSEEEHLDRIIPFVIAFNRTSPIIKTRIERTVTHHLVEASVPQFENQLNDRAAFKQMFMDGKTVFELDEKDVSNLAAAQANALAFTHEVYEALTGRRLITTTANKGEAA